MRHVLDYESPCYLTFLFDLSAFFAHSPVPLPVHTIAETTCFRTRPPVAFSRMDASFPALNLLSVFGVYPSTCLVYSLSSSSRIGVVSQFGFLFSVTRHHSNPTIQSASSRIFTFAAALLLVSEVLFSALTWVCVICCIRGTRLVRLRLSALMRFVSCSQVPDPTQIDFEGPPRQFNFLFCGLLFRSSCPLSYPFSPRV